MKKNTQLEQRRKPSLVPDAMPDETLLRAGLDNHPMYNRSALGKLGIGTTTRHYLDPNGRQRAHRTVTVPILFPSGKQAGLVINAFENPRAPKNAAGIVCDAEKLRSLNGDKSAVKTAILVSTLKDLFCLQSSVPEGSDDPGVFIFCPEFSENRFSKYQQYFKSDKPSDCDRILDFFVRHDIKLIACCRNDADVIDGDETDEDYVAPRAKKWYNAACKAGINSVLLSPADCRGEKSVDSFSDVIAQGGNYRRLIYLASTKPGPIARQSTNRNVGGARPAASSALDVLARVNRKLFSGIKPEIFACANEGTLKHQLSPEPSTLTIIGGSKAEGKTALIMDVCVEAAIRNDTVKVLYVNTDQTEETLVKRILSRMTGVSYNSIRDHTPTPEDENVLQENAENVAAVFKRFHFLCGSRSTNMMQIEDAVRETKPQILVVDHIQKIRIFERSDDEAEHEIQMASRERIDRVLNSLRDLISRFKLAVIVASAVSRSGYSTSGGSYGGELRDSSTLDYDATTVWKIKTVKNKPYNRLLINDKSKEYEFTNIPLLYEGEFMRFTEISNENKSSKTDCVSQDAAEGNVFQNEEPEFLEMEGQEGDE